MSGLEFAESTLPGTQGINYTQNVQADYTYAASKGMTLVRLAFLWERLQPTVLGALDTTYKSYIDNNISWAASAGMKVILEVHNYGGRRISGTSHKINNGTLTYAHFNDLWTRIAQAYVGNANVWAYDLMNEPNNMPVGTNTSNFNTTSTWYNAAQGAINAIRAVDTNHPIIVETDHYSGVQNFFNTYGSNPAPWWTDSADNLWYSCHHYFDSNNSGSYSGASVTLTGSGHGIQDHGDDLKALLDWAQARGVKIFIGEVGVPNAGETYGGNSYPSADERYLVALNDWYNVADQYEDVVVCHWASGQWYSSPTTLEPTSSYTVDRSQMKVVEKHLGTST